MTSPLTPPDSDGPNEPTKVITKVDKMFAKKNRTVLSEHYMKLVHDESSPDEEDNEDEDEDESDQGEVDSSKSVLKIKNGSSLLDRHDVGDGDEFLVLARRDHDITDIPMVRRRLPINFFMNMFPNPTKESFK